MKDYSTQGGSWKDCPQCGKPFFCTSTEWAYKMAVSRDGRSATEYFCKYSCLQEFRKGYEERKQAQRVRSAVLQHKRRKSNGNS